MGHQVLEVLGKRGGVGHVLSELEDHHVGLGGQQGVDLPQMGGAGNTRFRGLPGGELHVDHGQIPHGVSGQVPIEDVDIIRLRAARRHAPVAPPHTVPDLMLGDGVSDDS